MLRPQPARRSRADPAPRSSCYAGSPGTPGPVSVLASLSSADVRREPFAHLAADGVMAGDLYGELERTFPADERFIGGMTEIASNQAVRIPAVDIIDNPEFSPAWREFFRYHTSDAFWRDILRVMGEALLAVHPHLPARSGKRLEDWRVVRRGSGESGDVELDALFVVNTPVVTASSVRPAHVDKETEIFAGLLYMRPGDDRTEGGDLALYRFRGKPEFGGHYAPLSSLIEEARIGYAANRLVAFINSPDSVHGVTPRSPTRRYRRYVNLIANTPYEAFSLPRMSPWGQLLFWLERRGTKSHGVMAKSGYRRRAVFLPPGTGSLARAGLRG